MTKGTKTFLAIAWPVVLIAVAANYYVSQGGKLPVMPWQQATISDHPTTREIMEWGEKCKTYRFQTPPNIAPNACQRVDDIVKAKLEVCASRLGVRDLATLAVTGVTGNMSPKDWLYYCDQRFPSQ
jgi:hypothetical protein